MNLDKAYETWGQLSDNRELYYKTKTLFRKMWWLIPTNKPCSYYSLPVLARALQQANGAHSDKVSAASVMVHVLNFANSVNNDNPKPSFVFQDILDYTGEHPSQMEQTIERIEAAKEDKPLVKVKHAAKAKREGELARRAGTVPKAAIKREKNDAGIGSSEREQTRRDNGKSVVQLDAETLQVIKVWPSCFAAQKELGIKNVQRAIVRHGISGGFYWCRPGDEEDFKPMDKRANNRAPHPLTPEQKQLHKKVFDAPTRLVPKTLQEAHDDLQQAINEHIDEILRGCTQDELIAELRRRQWKGTLHITQTIEL